MMKRKTAENLLPDGKQLIPEGYDKSPCNLCMRKNTQYCSNWRTCKPYLSWYNKTVEDVRRKLNWRPEEAEGTVEQCEERLVEQCNSDGEKLSGPER